MIYQKLLSRMTKSTLGIGATESIIAADAKFTLRKYRKRRRRLKIYNKEFKHNKTTLRNLQGSCINHLRPVTEPLALVSQIQRSGGSLLSQLFDGHPEIHAHPHELKIGFPTKYTWPQLDLDEDPMRWLQTLFEPNVIGHFKNGYKKQKNMDETFPFLFLPSVQKELFFKHLSTVDSLRLRDVFDAYMTSYFGAWLNNQNNFGPKKFITAFTARLAMDPENMKSFFEIYPDGRLISIIRDPKNWYPSAAKHKPLIYCDIMESLKLWKQSAEAMLRNKERYGDRVCLLKFEDLICKTEGVMRHLSNFLGIRFDECLLIPSFNKYPIKANTSFKEPQHGIIESTLNRYKTLSQDQLDIIDRMTSELYQSVLNIHSKII